MKKGDSVTENHPSIEISQKGNCVDCPFYYDCPRMSGINHCYSSGRMNETPISTNEQSSDGTREP
jgi:hypothetical protein